MASSGELCSCLLNSATRIYVLKPLNGENKPLENVLDNCYDKELLSDVFYKLILKNC